MKKLLVIIFISLFFMNKSVAENKMILKLETGNVEIELFPDIAPGHVKRIKTLAKNKEYIN